MKSLIFMIVILTLILFSGCEQTTGPSVGTESIDYSIDQKLSCFCPGRDRTVRLFVSADTIADVVDLSNKIRLPANEWYLYKTIKGLFDEISSLDTSVFTVKISYDPVYHYPLFIYANPKPVYVNDTIVQIIMDAGFSYSTSNYLRYK